jgi:hypothetical protein
MKDLSDFSDVLDPNAVIETIDILEFEFDDGMWHLQREPQWHRWEIQFESDEGEEAIIVEREDFADGKLSFDIDGKPYALLLEDFDKIEKFVYEKGLID